MNCFIASYENYRNILKDIKRTGKYMDYREAGKADAFLILRHDIEFSVDRAYRMALIESEEGISSTYFLQIAGNAYNPFSQKNLDLIHEMIHAGHHIGLHYHLGKSLDPMVIRDEIRDQIRIMTELLHYPIDRYSMHRPVEASQYYAMTIDGMINAYSPEFFTHREGITEDSEVEVKYIADSKHRWNYGYPDLDTMERFPKIQLLIHPYSWSTEGKNTLEMFDELAGEKEKEILDTFDKETKIYREIKDQLEEKRGI